MGVGLIRTGRQGRPDLLQIHTIRGQVWRLHIILSLLSLNIRRVFSVPVGAAEQHRVTPRRNSVALEENDAEPGLLPWVIQVGSCAQQPKRISPGPVVVCLQPTLLTRLAIFKPGLKV